MKPKSGGDGALRPASATTWRSVVVRPAFIQFSVEASLAGYGPVVTQSPLGCQVEIKIGPEKIDTYAACLELADPEGQELDLALPEISDGFVGKRRDDIGYEDVVFALRVSFDRWLAVRSRPPITPRAKQAEEDRPKGGR